MDSLKESEIWRSIPPEEKIELMAKAHAKGIMSSGILIIVGCTIAVGLKVSWIMWGSLIISPFIFQFAAGKEWRGLKPRVMLEYLAARSAARRYAFDQRGKDLTPRLVFRGTLEEEFDRDHVQEALEAMIENTKQAEVWVSLFGDTVVMISERVGGAELKLGHLIDEKLTVSSQSASGGGDYSNDKVVQLIIKDKGKPERRFRLTSRYPAALVVFEKRLLQLLGSSKPVLAVDPEELALPGAEDEGYDNLFSFKD